MKQQERMCSTDGPSSESTETFAANGPPGDQLAPLSEYSPFGLVSFLIGIAGALTVLYSLVSIEAGFSAVFSSLCLVWWCGTFLASLSGIGLGIAGIVDSRPGKCIAVLGLAINAIYVILNVFFIYEWD